MLGSDAFIQTFNSQDVRNRVTIHSSNYKTPHILLNDERPEDSILGKKRFMEIPLEGRTLKAWMILPPNFDSTQSYPAIFYVYGGPGDQRVLNSFPTSQVLWLQYMAQQGFVVVSVDNRGTGARGADFRKMTYMKLGQLETDDQIAAAGYIAGLPFIDGSRMGIFGWSYGGYMSLMVMMQDKKPFKAAVSVAPVTHWKFYDTVYTERYMRTPIANPSGYEKGAPTLQAAKFDGDLLLVHGVADDNVHFQHSMEFIKAMVEAGKQFSFLAYPNKDHGIGGTTTRMHLYKAITDFFINKLK
jgi:dipeptidyl-peptidase-4